MSPKAKKARLDSSSTSTLIPNSDEIPMEELEKRFEDMKHEHNSKPKPILELPDFIQEQVDQRERNQKFKKAIKQALIDPNCQAPNPIPPVGRSFVLKHVFKDVSNFKSGYFHKGEVEEHCGLKCHLRVVEVYGSISVHLCFARLSNTKQKFSINTTWTTKLKRICGKTKVETEEQSADILETFPNMEDVGMAKRFELAWLKKPFLPDEHLSVEVHVKINKLTGVYKEDLRNFDESKEDASDAVLVVGDQKFYVLKKLLAAHSPFFKTLFLGQFQESNKSEIELTGIAPEDFQNFLDVFYGISSIDEITVEGILHVADMYDISMVIGKCDDFLMNASKRSIKKKFILATRYNLELKISTTLSTFENQGNLRNRATANGCTENDTNHLFGLIALFKWRDIRNGNLRNQKTANRLDDDDYWGPF